MLPVRVPQFHLCAALIRSNCEAKVTPVETSPLTIRAIQVLYLLFCNLYTYFIFFGPANGVHNSHHKCIWHHVNALLNSCNLEIYQAIHKWSTIYGPLMGMPAKVDLTYQLYCQPNLITDIDYEVCILGSELYPPVVHYFGFATLVGILLICVPRSTF